MDHTPGFVRADCAACNGDDVWLRCETCDRADHFHLDAGVVTCDCGARYDHARCTCGARVSGARLVAVPFDEGPLALADLEIDPRKVTVLGLAAVAAVVALGFWAL